MTSKNSSTTKPSRLVPLAWVSIALAVSCQFFNDIFCYEKTLLESLMWIWFTLTPIVPALFFLFSKKHVGATIAALVVIPFYAMAYYSDCVLPYQGGGASMVYVIVIMVGTPTALAAGFIANFVANKIASSSAD